MRNLLTFAAIVIVGGPALADAKTDQATTEVQALTKGALVYKIRHDKYPATLKDLVDARFVVPNLNKLVDSWGNLYRYDANGPKNGGRYPDIWTESPDKKLIGNWPDPKEKKDK